MGLRNGWKIGSGPPVASWAEGQRYDSQGWQIVGKRWCLATWNQGETTHRIEAEKRWLKCNASDGAGCGLAPSGELIYNPKMPSIKTNRGGSEKGGLVCGTPTTCVKAHCRILLNSNYPIVCCNE